MFSSAFSGTRRFFSVAPTPRALHAHRRGGDHGEGEAAQCEERWVVAAPVEAEHDVVCARGDVNGDEPRRHHPDRPLPAFHGCRPPGVVGGAEDRDSGTAHPHRRRGLTVIEVGAFRITDLAVMLARPRRPGSRLGTQTAEAAAVHRCRGGWSAAAGPRRPAPAAAPGRHLALGAPVHRRDHPPANPRTRLTSRNWLYDQERKSTGPWNPAHPARQPGNHARPHAENQPSAAASTRHIKIAKHRG
jgi:hypothetical protein